MTAARFNDLCGLALGQVGVNFQRLRESPHYLITLHVGCEHHDVTPRAAYPQAHAVVDDFGTLQVVRSWQ